MLFTELQYFGTISYIKTLYNAQEICFNEMDHFTKMSFKNRTIIASAQGPLNLTIPIVGGRDQKKRLTEIQIDHSIPWQKQHIKAIQSCYKRAPFYDYYDESLTQLLNTQSENLASFLLLVHHWVQKQIKQSWHIHPFIDLDNQHELLREKLIIYKDPWLPKNFMKINNPIKYHQVFENQIGFIPNLSIVDLLFCIGGKEIQKALKSS